MTACRPACFPLTTLLPAFAVLTMAASLLTAAPAGAQSGPVVPPAAAEAYRQGVTAHVRGDHAAARTAFETACNGGSVTGCVDLALMLAAGEGGPADAARARTMLTSACDAGGVGVGACHPLAVMRLNGEGGAADPAGARAAFNIACEADEPHACYDYAVMMIRGQGGERAPVDALAPLQKACDWDHPAGCYVLGVVMRESYGSLRANEIAEAFRRACDLGDLRGCDAPLTSRP